jgi:hypothetical protein
VTLSSKSLLLAAAAGALLLPSCASIFNRSLQPVKVTSEPSGLSYSVKDSEGQTVGSGITPGELNLKTSPGYFHGASYTFTFSKGKKVLGTKTLDARVSGWYFGNILIGGVIGMVVIDPLTGSMYTLPDDVHFNGQTVANVSHPQAGSLALVSIDQLTPGQRDRLVRL